MKTNKKQYMYVGSLPVTMKGGNANLNPDKVATAIRCKFDDGDHHVLGYHKQPRFNDIPKY